MATATAEHSGPKQQDQLLTIEEAAEYLRTNVSTMRYWQAIDKGPKSFKLGVRRLYRQSQLDEFIRQAEEEYA